MSKSQIQHSKLQYLFNQYLTKQASPEELDEFFDAIIDPSNKEDVEQMMESSLLNFEPQIGPFSDVQREKMFAVILAAKQKATKPSYVKMVIRYTSIAAAVITVLIGVGLLIYNTDRNGKEPIKISQQQNIVPGKNTATLTLANGKKIFLDDRLNGELAEQAGVIIKKNKDGSLVYELKGQPNNENLINTLSTTNGQSYQVRLPDGSSVWLNAASSLTYTASLLNNGKRHVKLEGEAYFEIEKDKEHPFIVESRGQEVEVLGTHFNINSYNEEPATQTTLLEGKIKLSSGETQTILKPGNQVKNYGSVIKVSNIDTESVVAWKNNEFVFEGQDFKAMMRAIGRWYDVEVIVDDSLRNLHLSVQVPRSLPLTELIKSLEATGDVKFKIEGRRIRVIK